MAKITREEWLNQAVSAMRPMFRETSFALPTKIKVSCGWPCRKALRGPVTGNRSIGQCFPRSSSIDGYSEIFISPVLENKVHVLETLVHELIHSIDDCVNGHNALFGKMARAMGLTGKLTATSAGPVLRQKLQKLGLPDYPHAELDVSTSWERKQSTRMMKTQCPECGYIARVTRKWLSLAGAPICPIDRTQMNVPQMTNTLGC